MSTETLDPMASHEHRSRESGLRPSRVGMIIFLMTEVMFFAGFLVAQSVLWAKTSGSWPPPGQPRLPMDLSVVNTLVLLGSGFCLAEGFRRKNRSRFLLNGSLILGSLFLVVQGYEWLRMLTHGLTVSSGVYGGFFYAIIGSHAAHAVGGLLVLGTLSLKLKKENRPLSFQEDFVPALFWFFVVGVWPVLFLSLYGIG